MRSRDKKIAMKKANIAFQKRINESKFSWDGKYANEDDPVNEKELITIGGEPWDEQMEKEKEDEELDEATFLGNDMEATSPFTDDGNIEEDANMATDVEDSQWFSDKDGERLTDLPHGG